MFSLTDTMPAPSQDFVALCQSQVNLLSHVFQADWSAIYLAAESSGDEQGTQLIPIVVYPPIESIPKNELRLPDSWQDLEPSSLFPMMKVSQPEKLLPTTLKPQPTEQKTDSTGVEPYQLVLPLIHQEIVLGVLVSRRQHYPWQREEVTQVEKIARTLAIARLFDQRQSWYQQQLSLQQRQQQQERDRLDNLFHQLRNPLSALRIFGKLLLKQLVSNEKGRTMVENMVRESEHLESLLQEFEENQPAINTDEDVITLHPDWVDVPDASSTLLLPGQSLNLTKLNIKEILDPLFVSARPIAQEKGIKLLTHIPANLPAVWANASALREIFSNLIDNSIKYTPKQGQIKIQAGLSKIVDDQVYQGVAIEDTGYGIPPAEQAHIFERHYRGLQLKEQTSGSGLGLAIVQELLGQMRGMIELSSPTDQEHNRGTTFIVWLPLAN